MAAGAKIDITLNAAGSTVNFTDAFWDTARTWSLITCTSRTGTFALGTITADAGARVFSNYGTFALGHTSTAVTLTWTPHTARENWRLTHFGTVQNTGTAADTADPNKDGENQPPRIRHRPESQRQRESFHAARRQWSESRIHLHPCQRRPRRRRDFHRRMERHLGRWLVEQCGRDGTNPRRQRHRADGEGIDACGGRETICPAEHHSLTMKSQPSTNGRGMDGKGMRINSPAIHSLVRPPHSPTPVPVLTVSGAAVGKANS